MDLCSRDSKKDKIFSKAKDADKNGTELGINFARILSTSQLSRPRLFSSLSLFPKTECRMMSPEPRPQEGSNSCVDELSFHSEF